MNLPFIISNLGNGIAHWRFLGEIVNRELTVKLYTLYIHIYEISVQLTLSERNAPQAQVEI